MGRCGVADDQDRLSDADRKSLRILAATTKAGGQNARLAHRLEQAAGSGQRADYEKAETAFNALEPESRRTIGTRAEKQAETEKVLIARRRVREARKPAAKPAAEDAPLEWAPLSADLPPSPPKNKSAREATDTGRDWELGQIPKAPAASSAPVPLKAKAKAKPTAPPPDEDGKTWDWQKVPEDPILSARRKKENADNPFAELRRQMLGPDADN